MFPLVKSLDYYLYYITVEFRDSCQLDYVVKQMLLWEFCLKHFRFVHFDTLYDQNRHTHDLWPFSRPACLIFYAPSTIMVWNKRFMSERSHHYLRKNNLIITIYSQTNKNSRRKQIITFKKREVIVITIYTYVVTL